MAPKQLEGEDEEAIRELLEEIGGGPAPPTANADIEVVEALTPILLKATGPSRERWMSKKEVDKIASHYQTKLAELNDKLRTQYGEDLTSQIV